MKCLSGNNLNKKEFENEEMAKNKLINTKKCLSNLGKFNGSNKNNIFKDGNFNNIIIKESQNKNSLKTDKSSKKEFDEILVD